MQESKWKTLDDMPAMITVEELMGYLRLSKGTVYDLLRSKKIVSIRIGGRIRVPRKALALYLEQKIAETNTAIDPSILTGYNESDLKHDGLLDARQ